MRRNEWTNKGEGEKTHTNKQMDVCAQRIRSFHRFFFFLESTKTSVHTTRISNMSGDTELNVDTLIARLLEGNRSRKSTYERVSRLVRGCRPGKIVQMTEGEVRGLCLKSREIFLSQPILLELEAPLKICGKRTVVVGIASSIRCFQVIFTGNIRISCACSNTVDFPRNRTICFSVIMSTGANNRWKPSVCYWPIRWHVQSSHSNINNQRLALFV